ncbi:ROK family protein [Paenibacillus sp. YPG26]|uniref:ROK family transcriptional regulator n=1 Tax=Paenibacillus sp. YPG26 TaxID=2878915 RepID=UPI00203EEAE7|nr:ROK family protein [Paenibacillus sp. YPG26]USB31691.1 ROK family protein [Paenibacillus sp. YPG26]
MGDLTTHPREIQKAILRDLRTKLLQVESATKAELISELGVSFPTISKFISRMEQDGEIILAGMDESSGGRRAKRYAYNPEYMLGLAIYLEKKETHYTVFNCKGENKEQGVSASVLTDDLDDLARQIEEIISKYPKIRTVAIGVPGVVNHGRILYIPDFEPFQNVDLKQYLEEKLPVAVVVENDMNAAVLGYRDTKRILDRPSLIYLYFGQNGPGSGIMINGELVRGSTSFSGEVSFIPLYDERNFQQAMNPSGEQDQTQLISQRIDAISRLVAAFTAIVNPHSIIFSQDEVNPVMLSQIAARSAIYIPEQTLPELISSDWTQDYLLGLQTLGIGLMVSEVNT